MGTKTEKIKIKLDLDGNKQVERGMGGVEKSVGSLAKRFTAFGAVVTAAKKLYDFTVLAGQADSLQKAYSNLTRAQGLNADLMLGKMRKASKQTISDMKLMKFANQGLLLGLPITESTMGELVETGRRLGKAMGIDAKQGLESLVVGIGRQSKLWLDNLGILIDVEKSNKIYAQSLGKTSTQLTDVEKKQAFFNATMKEARGMMKKLGEDTTDNAEAAAQASVGWENVQIALGRAFGPAFKQIMQGATEELNDFADTTERSMFSWGEALLQTLNPFRAVAIAMEDLGLKIDTTKSAFPGYAVMLRLLGKEIDTIEEKQRGANKQFTSFAAFMKLGEGGKKIKEDEIEIDKEIEEIRQKILASHKQSQQILMVTNQLKAEGLIPLTEEEKLTARILEMKRTATPIMEQINTIRGSETVQMAKIVKFSERHKELQNKIPVGMKKSVNLASPLKRDMNQAGVGANILANNLFAAAQAINTINEMKKGSGVLSGLLKLGGLASMIIAPGNPLGMQLMAGGSLAQAFGAQHGMDSTVDRPTLILAGEGNKKEHVKITPAPKDNNSNGNLTVNYYGDFYGNVDQLADKIVERSKLGFNKVAIAN